MIFTHLPQVANYIKKHHFAFGEHYGDINDTLDILGKLNTCIQTTACVGATFEAWQYAKGYRNGILKTLITIEKSPEGFWTVTEIAA